jgi:copper(I)-binding protein
LLKWLRRSEPKEVPAASLGPLQIVKPWARSSSSHPDIAGVVEIQAIRVKGPVLEMRKMDNGLVIPPANQQILKPRGYHLLMSGLASPLAVGGKLPITLVFEKAGSVTVDFAVDAPGAVGQASLSSS